MKPVDSKDKPKLIVLVLLSVAVIGYGLLQLTSGLAGATPRPSAKPEKTAAATPDAASTGQLPSLATHPDDPSVVPEPSVGDPFVPRMRTDSAQVPAGQPAPARMTKPLPGIPASVLASLGKAGAPPVPALPDPSGNPGPGPDSPAGATAPVGPVEVAPPPPPTLNVAGVLVAEPGSEGRSVAILSGSGEKRYVTAGDPVGNGYVVASVSLRGVEVVDQASKSRRFTFALSKR